MQAETPAQQRPPIQPLLILFDAAGTLIETAEPVEMVYQRVFERHGARASASCLRRCFREVFAALPDPEFANHATGDLAERLWWRQVVERTASTAGHSIAPSRFESCFDELFGHYASGAAWRLFPEVGKVVGHLRAEGHRLAVVSNFDRRLHRILAELEIAELFDVILTSADVGARKPQPDLLLRAMARFPEAKIATTCLVGDSGADRAAASAAGIAAYILDRPPTTLRDFQGWLAKYFRPK